MNYLTHMLMSLFFLNKSIKFFLDELINTHVDPVLIRRTVRQSVRERSRSPLAQPAPHYRERLSERPRYVFRFLQYIQGY